MQAYLTICDEEELIRSVWQRWEHWLRTRCRHHAIGLVTVMYMYVVRLYYIHEIHDE